MVKMKSFTYTVAKPDLIYHYKSLFQFSVVIWLQLMLQYDLSIQIVKINMNEKRNALNCE